ncbi:MAG: hypothetical protein M3376_01240 [Actinomycetota bacterium]|nr:hypothetical protein [Actinomycetota bacterium]
MIALREALRQVGRDLIDKRLWPIAVALLAAIVIVPVLIGRSSSDAPAPAGAPAAAAAAPASGPTPSPAASTDDAAGSGRHDTAKVRDPFFDPPKAPTASAATTATSAVAAPPADTAAPKSGPSGGTPEPAATGSTARTPSPATAPAQRRATYYRAVVRWGARTGTTPRAVARLTPLGGKLNPAALYLGVAKADALYAVFVLGPNSTSHGAGACRTGTSCRMIALRAGDTRSFVVRSPDGGVPRRFTLRVRSVRAIERSVDVVRRARRKVHPDGRAVLHAMWGIPAEAAVLRRASYDKRSGLLRAARPEAVEKATE